jgi:hypothetical protein
VNELERDPDPLRERAVRAVAQPLAQLRLPDQHDRDEVPVVQLEVREEADLLERRLARDEVRLVHDEESGPPLPVEREETLVDLVEDLARLGPRLRDA